ncbi:unnamed protein product [Adineta steineri]|uniref:PKD domain-containing protein n=1 Tax=Adineta steineri TaxID=433720 RepID=A0A814UTS2_9BILA|nr:unnamed protein product [Adineta steineri]
MMDRTRLFHVLISLCLIHHTKAVSVATQSLLGCGTISRPMRMYPYSPANYNFNTNTPGTCMQACSAAGYAYASVSAGRLCFCGSVATDTTKLNSTTTSCQVIACTGDPTVYCGDTDYELVYTSVGDVDSASITFSSGGSPMALSINQNYQFSVSYQGAVNYISYQVNFGDGTKTGWFNGTINSATTVSHIFSTTGQFSVSVAARTVVGMQPKMYALTVKVIDQILPLDVSITCPNVTATKKTVSCIFTSVRGTGLTDAFSYNIAGSSHSILNIPDAKYHSYGSSSVTNNPTTDSSASLLGASDIAILPQSTVKVAGRLATIQFYSSGAGTINIYLLRRVCTVPSMYCYDANTCGTCANAYSLQCSSSVYSTVSRSCVNETSSQRYQQSIYSGAQFQIVATYPITTTGAGYQQIIANSSSTMNQTALVGDILAFQGPYIAKEMTTDTTQDYRCITPTISSSQFTCSIGNISSSGSTYRYLLQVTIIEAVQIAPNMIYYATGNYNITSSITQNNVTSLSASTILPVVDGIDWIEIVAPATSNINIMLSFVANVYPSTATATLFIWYINGNNTYNSTTNMMNVSFPIIGTYIIAAQAQNLLSHAYNTTTIILQDTITNFTLVGANVSNVSISQPSDVARFQIKMATGSNYACQINFDTTQTTTSVYYYTSGYIPGSYVTHQYLLPGVYNIFASCVNSVNNATYSLTHYVQYPITGVQLQQRGVVKDTSFRINITFTQGTSPQFRILIDGAQVNYTYNTQNNLIQTTPFSGSSGSTNYSVDIYAWNYISSVYVSDTFYVVSLITNPQIRASTTNILFPGPILFEYTMDSGSNTNVTFTFSDTVLNSPVTCLYSGDYITGVWSSCSGTNHTFAIPGTLTIVATFTNAVSTAIKYLTVTLSTSVKNIQLSTLLQLNSGQCAAAFVDTRAIASFIVTASSTTVKPASNAQVLIIPDAVNQPNVTLGPFSLTMDYFSSPAVSSSGLNVIYSAPGNYSAVLQVSNSVDSVNISCFIRVTSILQAVYYSIDSINFPFGRTLPFQTAVYVTDPNPGAVTLSWNYGDGTPIVTRPRTALQSYLSDNATHVYSAVGIYTLSISAMGPINTVVQNFSINVQYPVTAFSVTFAGGSSSLTNVYSGASVAIPVSVQETSSPLSTNSHLIINYNDSSALTSNSIVNGSLPYNGSYTFTSPGVYYVNFTVYNLASVLTQIYKISINAPFNNYALSVCYLLSTSTSDSCNLTVNGGVYSVPKQSQIVVYVSWSNPSGIPDGFNMLFRSGSTLVYNQSYTFSQATNVSVMVGGVSGSALFRLVYNIQLNSLLKDGAYTLEVQTHNPTYTSTSTLNIYILSAVAGLVISDKNIVVAQNVPKTFIALYQNFSAISCLYIQYSDNTIQCYGDSTSCSSLPSDFPSTLSSCPLPIQPFTYNNGSVSFTKSFNKTSAYLYAYAWNRMSSISSKAYLSFPLTSSSGCTLPQIQFAIYNPLISGPRIIQRSAAFSVSTTTTLNCTISLNNTKQWGIYLCNVNTQVCTQTTALIQLISQLASAKTSEIYLQTQALPTGTYLFNYTVSMTSAPGFASSAYTYITIIRSNIQVNLLANGTSVITNGVTQTLLFQPGVFSVDPDSTYFDATSWTFAYYCRVYGLGSYPMSNGSQLTLDSTIIDPANPSCFASPGNTSFFNYGPNNNRSYLYIQPHALATLQSYEFQTIITNIYDTTLQYSGYALVTIQEMDSVSISVNCIIKMCLPNAEYQRVNPTSQALVQSSCVSCANVTNTIIQWSVYSGIQTNYPNGDIKWVLFSNISAYDNIFFYGRTTTNFTVVSALFLSYPSVQYWQFSSTYTVTRPSGIASGSGSIRFSINSPPSGGTCTTDKTNGTTMTTFTLTCSNWYDSDGIQAYTFYAYTTTNGTRTPLGFTSLTSMSAYIPSGDANANYIVRLSVDISDIYGAVTSYNLSSITVTVDQTALASILALSQSTSTQGGSSNAFLSMLSAADQNTASQLITSIAQTLNAMSADTQATAISSGGLSAATLSVSGLFSSSSSSSSSSSTSNSSSNSSANSTAALIAYTAVVNSQAAILDTAIQYLSNLTITDINSVSLQAAAMNALCQSPSTVTRQSTTLAASKCTDLVNALSAMSDTSSYEDVQSAVSSIAQLASNIVTAVNTPLLSRGVTLSSDSTRANTLPADYETDLDSPWSNPNLFSDGGDFSAETIEKNRNIYYQQQSSSQVSGQMDQVLASAVSILSLHMNVGQTNVITTDSISMITQKRTINDLNSFNISQAAGTSVNFPNLDYCAILFKNQSCASDSPVTINSIVTPMAPAGNNGRSQVSINMSRSIALGLIDSTGTTILVEGLSESIQIIIPRDTSITLPAMAFQNVTGQTTSTTGNNNRQFSLFYVNVTGPSATITLSATFEFKSDNSALGFLVIYRFDAIPYLNSTINKTNGQNVFCPNDQIDTASDGYLYSYFLDNIQTANHTYTMFGIRELNSTEFNSYCSNNGTQPNSSVPITDNPVNFTANYYIRVYTSGCYYIDSSNNWQSAGCVVGTKTSHTQTECYTNHLTTFAGGWIVLPAPINWNYVFANASFAKNMTIYLTLILLLVLYILFMIYARYKDKKDVEKLGVTPLPDNILNDKYYYQIIVFTGLRRDAGTESKVHFIISGDDEETGVRTFEDKHRKVLQRGGIDSFIMAVSKPLGRLNYMRVWHDNSGTANKASWFLKYIVVRNLQTMEKNHFICQQWLAVEKDDGVVDRLIPVAGDEQKQEFSYLLSKKTFHSMSDGHLWFSIFLRPPSIRFTRCQRCTCCFVLLLMAMLMNIMYYDIKPDSSTPGGITIGPFYITPEQISIGLIVELICFLPSTILVEMFRRLRPRRPPVPPIRAALQKMQDEQQQKQQQAALNDIHPQLTNFVVDKDPVLSRKELDNMRNTLATPLPDKQNSSRVIQGESKPKKKKPMTLPWWFIFIAYSFSFVVVCVSGFFLFARGVEFGDEKTRKWLTSSVTGFFSSILLTQPVKVVLFAIFFALIIRKDEDIVIDKDEDDIFLDGDEEYLHAFDDQSLLTFRSKSGHIPLSEGEIAYARQKRLNEIKMWEIIKEILAYGTFLWMLYLVSYSNRDPNSFYLMQHLQSDFLNVNSATEDFTQISRMTEYWEWLDNVFVNKIRASTWYNGAPPANLAGFIADRTNRVLGWASIRQLRVKSDSCTIMSAFQDQFSSCEAGYNMFNEDTHSYYPGWTSLYNSTVGPLSNYSTTISNAFMYNKSDTLGTYSYAGEHATYSGGGYVYEFRGKMSDIVSNLSALRELSWIDVQTRAVIIQMSLYNPNVNLFTLITILAEFLPTGGVYPSARFEPITLLSSFEGFALFKLICSIAYMGFIIYYMQREIRSLLKQRMAYFRDFWSYVEVGIIACSWAGLGVYVWRIHEGNRVGELFKETKGYTFISLQMATYVDDSLTFLLGFCCFFGTIKFLRLLRFYRRLSTLSGTLSYAFKDLLAFSLMFAIIFISFLTLFYLLFSATIMECSDPIRAAQMLFEMMLLKFDVSGLLAANAILGPFVFVLFIIFVVFICMTMFIAIIADAFRVVRENVALQGNEYEIVGFMINQFKKVTGLGTTQEADRLHLNPYDGSKVHYHDPITSFPDKMDQLIVALNKIYMDTKRNDTFTLRPNENYNPLETDRSQDGVSTKKNKKMI